MKQDNFLITSSDNIPYSEIENQFGIVDSQIVVGANIFRDVFAGFRDLFGGETKGYKKDIDRMKNAALMSIKKQAKEKGANAVISLKIDLEELSGGGKSMFMINIYGSAIKLKEEVFDGEMAQTVNSSFPSEEIDYFKRKLRVIKEIEKSEDLLSDVNLNSLSEYNLWNKKNSFNILKSGSNSSGHELNELEENLSKIPTEFIVEFIDDNVDKIHQSLWAYIYNSLGEKNWFDFNFLEKHLNSPNHINRFRALDLCALERDFYERKEADHMEYLGNFILSDFDSSIPKISINKLMKNKEVYVCPNCLQENESGKSNCICGANEYGLSELLTPESIGKNLLETSKAIRLAFEDLN